MVISSAATSYGELCSSSKETQGIPETVNVRRSERIAHRSQRAQNFYAMQFVSTQG